MKIQKENKCSLKLSDFCEDIVDCEHKTAPIQESGIPCIRTKNIFNGYLDLKNANKVSEETYLLWTKRLKPSPGDIILAREAPVGEVGIVPQGERVCLGQRTVLIRPNKKLVDPYYLLYLLLTKEIKNEMTSKAEGSTVSHLNMSEIRSLNMPDLPSLAKQISISSIIRTLDDKIDLNRQMNSTIEQIAQTLFKHWFIDFEFPDENGNPYKSSGGRMVDSEFGEIPEGWEIKELKEFGEIICGKTPSKNKIEYYENGKIPFIKIPDMRNQIFPVKTEDKLSEIGAKTISKKKLPPLSVCVSCIATVGMICMTYEESSYTNQQINSIIPNEYGPYYLYFKMKELYDKLNLWASGGSATLNLNTSEFSKIKIIAPPKEIINTFNDATDPIFKEILSKSLEIVNLSDIRDSLLPKLMSGKIRVEC